MQTTGPLLHVNFGPDREFAHADGFAVARRCLRFLVVQYSYFDVRNIKTNKSLCM